MRIIRGTHKGRTIHLPKSFNQRPTTDVAKEGLFNILENTLDFETLRVLDLFSGTGSISYEFASRGCPEVVCVEQNYKNFAFIKKTVASFKFQQITPIKADAFKSLKHFGKGFNLIFADPPYAHAQLQELPNLIFQSGILAKEGLLIIEHPIEHSFSGIEKFQNQRKYGKVNFSFFEG